ncbi:MAG: type I-E CRISPR-associated protein Cas5/CasD [Dehalococcoidales bacterium]|nr:type I-E CRISPR-associated protein Cas5/CasD [Dehalococcoidales bacterium]
MAVLLLRLSGPMQSWGTQSRFSNRDTELEPSKSGVIGLLCAAMGIKRNDTVTIEKLAKLKMGVRIDKEGSMKKDFHTALQVAKAGGGIKDCEPSDRYYLADACFLVALAGDADLIKSVNKALQKPVWQLFLGKKSFVPSQPVYLPNGYLPQFDSVEDALRNYPYLCQSTDEKKRPQSLRLEIDTGYGEGEKVRHDQPECFVQGHRKFVLRYVTSKYIDYPELPQPKEDEKCIFLV